MQGRVAVECGLREAAIGLRPADVRSTGWLVHNVESVSADRYTGLGVGTDVASERVCIFSAQTDRCGHRIAQPLTRRPSAASDEFS